MKKIALIGAGRIGWQLESDANRYHPCTHLGAVVKLAAKKNNIQIDVVCDLSEKLAKDAVGFIREQKGMQEHPTKTQTDFRKALTDKPDVAIIATSTFSHFTILKEAIEQGVDKIVVEKPIVADERDLKQLQQLLKKHPQYKEKIWVNYERRYHKKYLDLKKNLDKQLWGKPMFYRGWMASPSSSFTPNQSGEGILLHDTTHLLDLAFFLFGDARLKEEKKKSWLASLTQTGGAKTHVLELFHRESGIEGSILSSRFSPFFHAELEIVCERARIRVGNGFLSIEKTVKSRLYRNFVSLENPLLEGDSKVTLTTNPFMRMYKEVLADTPANNVSQKLEQAIKNVEILK